MVTDDKERNFEEQHPDKGPILSNVLSVVMEKIISEDHTFLFFNIWKYFKY